MRKRLLRPSSLSSFVVLVQRPIEDVPSDPQAYTGQRKPEKYPKEQQWNAEDRSLNAADQRNHDHSRHERKPQADGDAPGVANHSSQLREISRMPVRGASSRRRGVASTHGEYRYGDDYADRRDG